MGSIAHTDCGARTAEAVNFDVLASWRKCFHLALRSPTHEFCRHWPLCYNRPLQVAEV